jgi:hypothetical protein
VLQGEAYQAIHNVVGADELGGAVRPLQSKQNFRWLFVLMDADVERALAGNADLLRGVVTGRAGRWWRL